MVAKLQATQEKLQWFLLFWFVDIPPILTAEQRRSICNKTSCAPAFQKWTWSSTCPLWSDSNRPAKRKKASRLPGERIPPVAITGKQKLFHIPQLILLYASLSCTSSSILLIMRPLSSFLAVSSLLCSPAIANPAWWHPSGLDSFIAAERAIALQGALNNIGPNGSLVPGAGAGYVVASPSTENPNCQS